jgi:hypothetical protein
VGNIEDKFLWKLAISSALEAKTNGVIIKTLKTPNITQTLLML